MNKINNELYTGQTTIKTPEKSDVSNKIAEMMDLYLATLHGASLDIYTGTTSIGARQLAESIFVDEEEVNNLEEKITDSNGNIKEGFEVFDFNGDKKFDETEKSFFIGGGKVYSEKTGPLTIENFIIALRNLDRYGSTKGARDEKIEIADNKDLYKVMQGAKLIVERFKNISDEMLEKYKQAMSKIVVTKCHEFIKGDQTSDKISIKTSFLGEEFSVNTIGTTLVHELTHYVATNFSKEKIHPLNQEVSCFYMETVFNRDCEKMPKLIEEEANLYKKLKKEHPEMSNKELAIETFKTLHGNSYLVQYGLKDYETLETGKYLEIFDLENFLE